jgi:RNA polymerase sigma factor (sigma-70 family)
MSSLLMDTNVDALLVAYHRSGDEKAREQALVELMPLVRALASRYAGRGEPLEDLVQVGSIGLIKAVDRFDVDRGVDFASYAVPTIVGEIRRHFRDKAWAMHVPRRLKELSLRLSRTLDQLTTELGRSPTIAELAAAAGVEEEDAIDALDSMNAYSTRSLHPSTTTRTTACPRSSARKSSAIPRSRTVRSSTPGSTRSTSESARSWSCGSSTSSPSRRSHPRSASRRCTSRACCAVHSRQCAGGSRRVRRMNELVRISFPAKADYLLLARLALAGIARDVEVSDELLADLKLAVTEACGNSVRHAYPSGGGDVTVAYSLEGETFEMTVEDRGIGVAATEPAERAELDGGMGMSIIRTIVDDVAVEPGADGRGTVVRMRKRLANGS